MPAALPDALDSRRRAESFLDTGVIERGAKYVCLVARLASGVVS